MFGWYTLYRHAYNLHQNYTTAELAPSDGHKRPTSGRVASGGTYEHTPLVVDMPMGGVYPHRHW